MSEQDPSKEGTTGGVKPDISDAEVDALLEKVESGNLPAQAGRRSGFAEPYDLVAPDKIVRWRMPVLDRINERWMGDFQRKLGDLVRRPIEADVREVEIRPYGEWQAANPALASFNLFSVKPWQRNALVAIDGDLLFVLVDAYYGGTGRTPADFKRESLTPTELRLNSIIVALFADHFQQAFEPIAVLDIEYQKTETNPHYAQIATPSETVVILQLEVSLEDTRGSISLVFPLSMLDPVREKLSEGLKTVSRADQQRWLRSLEAQLRRTQLELASVFLETEITMKDLLKLKPGDILPIEMPKTATLYAGEQALLSGKFGLSRGYHAISIVGPCLDAAHSTKETSPHE